MGPLLLPRLGPPDGLHRQGQAHQRPPGRRHHRAAAGLGPLHGAPGSAGPVQAGPGAGAAALPGRGGGLSVLRHDPARRAASDPDHRRSEAARRGVHVHRHPAGVRQPAPPAAGHRECPRRPDRSGLARPRVRRGRGQDRHAAGQPRGGRPAPPPRSPLPPVEPLVALGDEGFTSTMDEAAFTDGVRRAKEFIAAGDAYQVVLSRRLDTELRADPFTVYRALRTVNPSPYLFFLRLGKTSIVGSSPGGAGAARGRAGGGAAHRGNASAGRGPRRRTPAWRTRCAQIRRSGPST